MPEYSRTSVMPVVPAVLQAYHSAPGITARLTPPWEQIKIVHEERVGTPEGSVSLDIHGSRYEARFAPTTEGFDEFQTRGPFASWTHEHRFLKDRRTGARFNPTIGLLQDNLRYEMPTAVLGRSGTAKAIVRDLDRTFIYRHARTRLDLVRQQAFASAPRQRIVVSGASGLIGRQLCAFLTTAGHRVDALVRREPRHREGGVEIRWDPASGQVDAAALEGADTIIHLAGATLNQSWSRKTKEEIRNSRIESTALLARTIASLGAKPRTFISASAIGYYGDRGVEPLTEDSRPGEGFLADLCVEWERAAQPVEELGVRLVLPRIGIVLSSEGGALAELESKFKLGLGGRLGDGFQYWPWISIDDTIGALHFALMNEHVAGPVNLAAPGAVRQFEFAETLARLLKVMRLGNIPEWLLKAAFGEMGREVLLRGTNVVPEALEGAGFTFLTPSLEQCLRWELGLLIPELARK